MEKKKFIFDRNPNILEDNNPSEEEKVKIVLPEKVESEISNEPLNYILERSKFAGVTEEMLDFYQEAFFALNDRPSIASNYSNAGELDFSPQDYYFAPYIRFGRIKGSSDKKIFSDFYTPDLLSRTSYKIRAISKEESANTKNSEPTGLEILERFQSGPTNNDGKLKGIERYITKINRLTYRLHEPLHILQSVWSGDLMNTLKVDLKAEDLINPEKEAQIITTAKYTDSITTNTSELFPDSPLIMEREKFGNDETLIANNEATMDILSDFALGPYIKQNSELSLWLHNTLSATFSAMKAWKEKILFDRQSGTELNTQTTTETYEHMKEICILTSNAYFAAFANSHDAASFLKNTKFDLLGKVATADVMEEQNFDQTDIYNLLCDLKTVLEADFEATQEKKFSSGKLYLETNRPIDQNSIDKASEIIVAAIKNEWTNHQIDAIFKIFSNPTTGSKMHEVIEKNLNVKISAEDVNDMQYISEYLYFNTLGKDYPYYFMLRKGIYKKLEEELPEENNKLIRELFFKAPLHIDNNAIAILTGFDQESVDLLQNQSLGICDINVPDLDEKDKAVLLDLQSQYDTKKQESSYQTLVLIKMIEIKRKQKEKK